MPSPYYYYCDGRDTDYTQWSRAGSTPYISAIDYPTNYVSVNGVHTAWREGDFFFADPGAETSETLDKVYIEIYAKGSEDPDLGYPSVSAEVWDGSTWTAFYFPGLSDSFAWLSVECTSKINSWAKLQNAQVRLRYTGTLTVHSVTVDAARFKATTAAPPTGIKGIKAQVI
jgi:hypothetical protein